MTGYWAALSLSFRQIFIMFMNIIAWGPQVKLQAEHGPVTKFTTHEPRRAELRKIDIVNIKNQQGEYQ
jgi:hypothetical protein